MNRRIIIAAALVLGLLAATGCTTRVVTSDGLAPLNTVTSAGSGEALAAPDMAEMYFGASVLEPDAKAALGNAGAAAEAITEAVKAAGVSAEDIQTANVSVFPEYRGGENKAPEITGYRASVQVRVKIRDLAAIGEVISSASDAGANEINGPTFMLDDDEDAQSIAIEDAIDDARRRAEVMAGAAGRTLGGVISVSEAGVSIPPVYWAGLERAAADYSIAIEPGQLNVTASVTVVFELK
jgi:hypothetical protein